MSDTTNTAESGAGAAAPADTTPNVTAQQTQGEQTTELTDEQREAAAQAEAAKQAEEKRKNRTKQYIDRINAERAAKDAENIELRRRLAELESRQSQPQHRQQQADTGPTLEQYGYDLNAYQQARDAWVLDQAQEKFRSTAQQQAAAAREQETLSAYNQRAAEFADQHPDFEEVVGSIEPQFLPPQLQAAILAHPNGPEIAYHLGTNDEALWNLASIRADLLPAAVQRLAARLGAAPAASQTPAAASTPSKPISNAPPPVPTVGGRAPAAKDPERMTTDEWLVWRNNQLRKKD